MTHAIPVVTFELATDTDFEQLAAIRVDAMRESLERIGRFDPARARERLRNGFQPEYARHILADGARVGFFVLKEAPDALLLEHLYLTPATQGRGVGSTVLQHICCEADARELQIRLGALRDSAANQFYLRHGFAQTGEDAWDIYYARQPQRTAT